MEITCEVRTGATPQWKIQTHDLVNPVEGINITTTGNVSVLVADQMGLDKFGEVEGSSILNVSCVPSNKGLVGSMGASEQRCLIVCYGKLIYSTGVPVSNSHLFNGRCTW